MAAASESAGGRLGRAVGEILGHMESALADFATHPGRSAHDLRVDCKQVAALVALAGGRLGAEAGASSQRALRKLKGLFAGQRDGEIIRGMLQAHGIQGPAIEDSPELPGEAGGLLAALRRMLAAADWERVRSRDVEEGLARTRALVRRRGRRARKQGRMRDFHAWRKAVKRLLYQAAYLERPRLRRAASRTGESLGELQDIAVTTAWLEKGGPGALPPSLADRRRTLRRQALRRGRLLLA